jgi:N-acyl-L-homoserine lactone synthetase
VAARKNDAQGKPGVFEKNVFVSDEPSETNAATAYGDITSDVVRVIENARRAATRALKAIMTTVLERLISRS